MVANKQQRVELILIKMGLLDQEGLTKALDLKRQFPDKKIEHLLVEHQIISEFDLIRAYGVKYNLPLVNLAAQRITPEVLRYLPEAEARQNFVIPVHETEYVLHLATADPVNYYLFEKISQSCGKQVSPLLATKEDIQVAINLSYIQQNVNSILTEIELEYGDLQEAAEPEPVLSISENEMQSNAVVRVVSVILEQAHQRKASDIHIEPMENTVHVRLRIDGDLVETMSFSKATFSHLASRFKVLGALDIAEKRLPQDGRMSIMVNGEKINMRISTLPTIYGEKIVIRLLGSSNPKDIMSLEQLQMEPYIYAAFTKAIQSPNGIILLTGPTGSGKSTTVYASLKELAKPNVNLITVEDPVEKILPGVNQVQVNARAGLTFAAGLRSILRQDPDIVMIGEIRDSETVTIAARAAITGHLVVSTMHTNDAPSAYMRMIDMGVEPYMVASSVICVAAQRLMKKICNHCKEAYEPEADEWEIWRGERPEKIFRGRGCTQCNNSGYSGRMAIYEVALTDPKLRELVINKAESEVIKQHLVETQNFKDLGDNAQLLVERGITTLKELQKIRSTMDT